MFEISRLSVYPSLTHSSTALSGEDRVPLYVALLLAVGEAFTNPHETSPEGRHGTREVEPAALGEPLARTENRATLAPCTAP